jgi:hypothetical protein
MNSFKVCYETVISDLQKKIGELEHEMNFQKEQLGEFSDEVQMMSMLRKSNAELKTQNSELNALLLKQQSESVL